VGALQRVSDWRRDAEAPRDEGILLPGLATDRSAMHR
jgi:hypothetical protein